MTAPHVLLVDDEPAIRNSLMRVLADKDYRIFTASNGIQALAILKTQEIDLIISDEKMPYMTGANFLREVRKQYPETVRIVLTGQPSIGSMMAAINEGEIFRFLLKPWNDAELLETVRLGLAQRSSLKEGKASSKAAPSDDRKKILSNLEQKYPGIRKIDRNADGTITL